MTILTKSVSLGFCLLFPCWLLVMIFLCCPSFMIEGMLGFLDEWFSQDPDLARFHRGLLRLKAVFGDLDQRLILLHSNFRFLPT